MTTLEVKTFLRTLQNQVAGESLEELLEISESLALPKGTVLMQEGKSHDCFYILIRGSAKAFHWKDGEVSCSWFAFENDVLATMGALDGQASDETIELMEDSTLIQINSNAFARLAENNLAVARLSFHWLAEHTKFLGEQVDLHTLPSRDRYEKITAAHPELLQRVSLTDLASFLGMRKETLSRVRGKAGI
jgi:CRP-like cAMP-binding protein